MRMSVSCQDLRRHRQRPATHLLASTRIAFFSMTDDLLIHPFARPRLGAGASCRLRLFVPASICVNDLHTHGGVEELFSCDWMRLIERRRFRPCNWCRRGILRRSISATGSSLFTTVLGRSTDKRNLRLGMTRQDVCRRRRSGFL